MQANWLVRLLALSFLFTTGCSAARPNSPAPEALPSPPSTWTIELTQTGGFAGVQLWVEVTSEGQLTARDQRSGRTAIEMLPTDSLAQLRQLVQEAAISESIKPSTSCADCFLYSLALTSDSGTQRMEADDVTLGSSGAQALIAYLRSLRDAALAPKP